MPQIRFSVSQATAERLRSEAKAQGTTVSALVAGLIEGHFARGWPPGYLSGIRERAKKLKGDFEFKPSLDGGRS